jgi:predicted glycogen debranching enzyme
VVPAGLTRRFNAEFKLRTPMDSYQNCLTNAAQQFIVRRNGRTDIKAGFHWYGTWGRDTFMALPGLLLSTGDHLTAGEVIDSMVSRMKNGMFPTTLTRQESSMYAVDAPLWFIWSLQQYQKYEPSVPVWKTYGKAIKSVLSVYREGTSGFIRMLDNGLIYAARDGYALTWMDSVIGEDQPVTRRPGCPVEVNALWYNAVVQSLEWAAESDSAFTGKWMHLPEQIRNSFIDTFWSEELGYLADYTDGDTRDFSVRPNQVIAVSVDHSPLGIEQKKLVLDKVESELLTPKGLRSLSPKNENYKGTCEGNQETRYRAYHQGTAWPWLLEHFARGYLDVHKKSGQTLVKRLYHGFEDALLVRAIGSISQAYDGNPPHEPRGAISHATSVASLLRIGEMIDQF